FHDWPGNVRELRNIVDRSCLLSQGTIEPEHLMLQAAAAPPAPAAPPAAAAPARQPAAAEGAVALPETSLLRDAEQQLILRTLRDCKGNKTRAAARRLSMGLEPAEPGALPWFWQQAPLPQPQSWLQRPLDLQCLATAAP